MKEFNASRVRSGDQVQVSVFVNETWVKGNIATVLSIYPEFVLVRWNGEENAQSTLFHSEYEILPAPRMTTGERIACVLIPLVLLAVFLAGYFNNN